MRRPAIRSCIMDSIIICACVLYYGKNQISAGQICSPLAKPLLIYTRMILKRAMLISLF